MQKKSFVVAFVSLVLSFGCKNKLYSSDPAPAGCISIDFWVKSTGADTSIISSLLNISGQYPKPPTPSGEISYSTSDIIIFRKNVMRDGRSDEVLSSYFNNTIDSIDHESLKKYGCILVKATISDESGVMLAK